MPVIADPQRTRVPGALQHAVLLRRPGTVPDSAFCDGPGSAVQRCTLHRARDTHSKERPMTTRSKTIAAFVAASTVLLAVPAAAMDGEILIDQAKVNAGAITQGDAPGFPATLSRPGRYKLTGNLKVPAGKNGIEVAQHDVTIDLNGFTISSNPPGEAPTAVDAQDVSGLRVTNGTITGFFYAIVTGELGVIEDMRIVSSGHGVALEKGSRIRNSTIANGSAAGITSCKQCLIEQNVVTGNGLSGISVAGGSVLGNVIAGNGDYGLVSSTGDAIWAGYGNNLLFGNNGGNAQVFGPAFQLHPNVCQPACP
ncbi:MAG: phytase [Rhizobiales bacterium]|nr:phytase [Hyphomicrobiales bacterium]